MGSRSWSRIEEDQIIRLVKLCKDSRQLKRIHAHLVVNGQSQNNFLVTKLVREFTGFGELKHAQAVAESVENPNVYLWTAMIRGYSQQSESEYYCKEALLIYGRMHRCIDTSIAGDLAFTFTLSTVLKACASLLALREGMQVHAHVAKYGYNANIRIQTTLIDFYVKCGLMDEAQWIFDRMIERDVQMWNTMIAAHTKSGNMEDAISLFEIMREKNFYSWEVMITGYADLGQMDNAQELFNELLSCQGGEININAVIYTAMITGYAKCGDIVAARFIFDKMVRRDIASWNAMITAYSKAGLFDEALDLFHMMLKIGGDIKPNTTTIASVAPSCAQLGSIEAAEWIKHYIDSHGNELMNSHTVTALIDMHAKCGEPDKAYEVFKRWKDKDVVCYSSMIAGFGMHGQGAKALKIFSQLQEDGLKPDSICFIVVLSACSHAGLVHEGCQYFSSMKNEYSIAPTADHYMCMVDLLGRAGCIEDAYKTIVEVMPPVKPHAGVWGALLSACRIYGNVEIGEVAAQHLLELEPDNAGNYVLLSNMHAKAQRWEQVAKVRALMRSRGIKKPPGCSWIEIGGRTHKFLTCNIRDHVLEMMMQVLAADLNAQGYFPGIGYED